MSGVMMLQYEGGVNVQGRAVSLWLPTGRFGAAEERGVGAGLYGLPHRQTGASLKHSRPRASSANASGPGPTLVPRLAERKPWSIVYLLVPTRGLAPSTHAGCCGARGTERQLFGRNETSLGQAGLLL